MKILYEEFHCNQCEYNATQEGHLKKQIFRRKDLISE